MTQKNATSPSKPHSGPCTGACSHIEIDPSSTSPSIRIDEILDSYAKYQYQLHVDNDGSHQLNTREAREQLLALFKTLAEDAKPEKKPVGQHSRPLGDAQNWNESADTYYLNIKRSLGL